MIIKNQQRKANDKASFICFHASLILFKVAALTKVAWLKYQSADTIVIPVYLWWLWPVATTLILYCFNIVTGSLWIETSENNDSTAE